ncbi:MAG: hypothetical protein K9N55_14370 [Phycisphaerae bacterium]|nr:hypothetical protein [Phycisphaerae bacterium]
MVIHISKLRCLWLCTLCLLMSLVVSGCNKEDSKPRPGEEAGTAGPMSPRADTGQTPRPNNDDMPRDTESPPVGADTASTLEKSPVSKAIFVASTDRIDPAARIFQPGDDAFVAPLTGDGLCCQFDAAMEGIYEIQWLVSRAIPLQYSIVTDHNDVVASGMIHPEMPFSNAVEFPCTQGGRYLIRVGPGILPEDKTLVRLQITGPEPENPVQRSHGTTGEPPKPGVFQDEARLLETLASDPSLENYAALAELRYRKAIDLAHIAESELDLAAYELAIQYGRSAVDLAPENVAYQLLLGALYLKVSDQADYDLRAQLTLETVLTLQPQQRDALVMLTELCFRQQNFSECMDHAEAVVKAVCAQGTDDKLDGALVSMLTSSYILDGQLSRGLTFLGDMGTPVFRDSVVLGYAILLKQSGDIQGAQQQLARVQNEPDSSPQSREYARLLMNTWQEEVQG